MRRFAISCGYYVSAMPIQSAIPVIRTHIRIVIASRLPLATLLADHQNAAPQAREWEFPVGFKLEDSLRPTARSNRVTPTYD